MELLEDKDFFKLYYVVDGHYLKTVWIGFPPSAGFRAAMASILLAIEDKKTNRVLVDGRDARIATAEDQIWIGTEFLPMAVPRGYKNIAFLYPLDVVGQLSAKRALDGVEEVAEKQELDYFMEIFVEEEPAIAWLVKQN